MNEAEVKKLFIETGAIMEGHFLLTSGLHSAMYVEKFQVLQHPKYTECLCAALAERFKMANVGVVIGPVTGGILLAHEVGKALGTRAIFTERVDGKMTLRRGFCIEPGERVLVVEDIITTGGSVDEVIEVVKAQGGELVGVGVLVNRSGGKATFEAPLESLLDLTIEAYSAEECPMCKAGEPMTKRGSRNIK
ncbi:orotate phosphoribosyltransferase [Azotosporobacter soli]|uniref:orotate phosphoribosyltransferase n=1 Tax=Azotosporobacter soli TaxID=3055040 RepID=UPI0031FE7AA9